MLYFIFFTNLSLLFVNYVLHSPKIAFFAYKITENFNMKDMFFILF